MAVFLCRAFLCHSQQDVQFLFISLHIVSFIQQTEMVDRCPIGIRTFQPEPDFQYAIHGCGTKLVFTTLMDRRFMPSGIQESSLTNFRFPLLIHGMRIDNHLKHTDRKFRNDLVQISIRQRLGISNPPFHINLAILRPSFSCR